MLCIACDTHLHTECSYQLTKYSYQLDCVCEESEALFCSDLSSELPDSVSLACFTSQMSQQPFTLHGFKTYVITQGFLS